MDSANLARFLRTTVVLWALALVIAGLVSPPDPFTLLVYAVPLSLVAPIIAYVLTYEGGFDYLETKT